MLTLKPHDENTEVATLVVGKKKTSVWWHPIENDDLRNAVTDVGAFNTSRFRDRFELSSAQATEIFDGLRKNEVVEQHQQKYFQVKRHVRDKLIQEMDISDTPGEFVVNFDDTLEHSGHILVISSTGGGKTYFCVQMALRNLDGPRALRRHFLIISSEWRADKTLEPLKKEKYREFVTGVDVSEDSLRDSQFENEQDFFNNEVKLRAEHMPRGGVVFFDDAMDSCCPSQMRVLINRLLRVSRHQGVTLMVILHAIRSGTWSQVAYNSIRWLCLFPRSQKNKIVQYLNREIGLPLQQARETVRTFAQKSRTMIVRIQAPECLIGTKLIQLL